MNTALWIVQGVLAAAFLVAGFMKLTRSKDQLSDSMGWVDQFEQSHIRGIGAAEVAGALGLVLPGLTGVAPVLTPVAAVGLVALMVGAAITHARRGELPMIAVNVVLAAMAAFVAWGRFTDWPL